MYKLTYTSTRSEVWHWYWRAWAAPGGLWRLHVVVALSVALVVWLSGVSPLNESLQFFETTTVWVAVALGVMVLWPQLSFKPRQRTLNLNSDGWETTVGNMSGRRSWRDVRSVEDGRGAIVLVSSTGNALIVPDRAFENGSQGAAAFADIHKWHAEAKRGAVPGA